jgi:plastocyanin
MQRRNFLERKSHTHHSTHLAVLYCLVAVLCSCSPGADSKSQAAPKVEATPATFKVDPSTAGGVTGAVHFTGHKPARKAIDMSNDPACVSAHPGTAFDDSVTVNPNGTLSNVFVYVKSGLEGKTFETPSEHVKIDQQGCGFHPRVLGVLAGQAVDISNSDPVTHSIHPLAQINREWNHSQGAGEPPVTRSFPKPEVMIRVKCNIHSWMRACIGVVAHPYFAVTAQDGSFELPNLPPGDYVIEAWHETLGTQEQKITVAPKGQVEASFTFKGE